jgi:hypothetical protein
VDYRDDHLNLRTRLKLKLPHLTEGGADQTVATERQKKKPPPNHLVRLWLKYQHQDWMLEE